MRSTTFFAAFLLIIAIASPACRTERTGEPLEAATVAADPSAGRVHEAELAAERETLAERHTQLEQREAELAEQSERLERQQRTVGRQEERLAEREAELSRRIADLDRRLAELEAPKSPEPPEPAGSEATELGSPPSADRPEEADSDWRQRRATVQPASARQQRHRVTLPAGTTLSVELLDPLSSRHSRPGETFRAEVAADLTVGGELAVPAGSEVRGRVLEAVSAKRVGGQARLALAFTDLRPAGGPSTAIDATFSLAGRDDKKRDAATIGGAAAAGAVLGRVIDDDEKTRGTLLGAVVGAAAGAAAAATRGKEVELEPGTVFELELARPVHVVIEPAARSRT